MRRQGLITIESLLHHGGEIPERQLLSLGGLEEGRKVGTARVLHLFAVLEKQALVVLEGLDLLRREARLASVRGQRRAELGRDPRRRADEADHLADFYGGESSSVRSWDFSSFFSFLCADYLHIRTFETITYLVSAPGLSG